MYNYQFFEFLKVNKFINNEYKLRDKKDIKILDFGFGEGRYLYHFNNLNYKMYGVDVNDSYIAKAKDKNIVTMTYNDFLEKNIENYYDVCILSHVIEHIPIDDVYLVISKIIKSIKKDGQLIIATPLLGDRFYYDFTHYRPYYPQTIRQIFGDGTGSLSFSKKDLIYLDKIWFIKDNFKTRNNSFYYSKNKISIFFSKIINGFFYKTWLLSYGFFGIKSSWIGVYKKVNSKNE